MTLGRARWLQGTSRIAGWGSIGFVIFLGLVPAGTASAQTLDQAIGALLSGPCAGIGGPGAGFGPNLNALCASLPGGSGASVGGGAASVQSSAASILNRTIIRRLEEVRAEEGKRAEGATTLGMVNPFGAFLPVLERLPQFASSSIGDASLTTFNPGGDSRWKGLGLFASGLIEDLNRDVTAFQDGYKSNIYGVTAGADYRSSKGVVTGLALTYTNTDGGFRNGGNFSTQSYGGTLFSSLTPTDKTFVQFVGGYTRNNYLLARPAAFAVAGTGVSGIASSKSYGDVYTLGALLGYDQPIRNFTIGPRLGLNYSHTHILDFSETGSTGLELRYGDQYINSLQSVLGLQGSMALSTGFGVLVPQFNADYIHEFANSQRFITVQFVEDSRPTPTSFKFQNDIPVRNYFNLGAGLSVVLPNGVQPFISFRAMVGNSQFEDYAGTIGVRLEL